MKGALAEAPPPDEKEEEAAWGEPATRVGVRCGDGTNCCCCCEVDDAGGDRCVDGGDADCVGDARFGDA